MISKGDTVKCYLFTDGEGETQELYILYYVSIYIHVLLSYSGL